MSFTQWLTRSTPMPRCEEAAIATLIFVPTPSALAARCPPPASLKSPANGPTPRATSSPWVALIRGLTRSRTRSYASMSTPAAAYDSPSPAIRGAAGGPAERFGDQVVQMLGAAEHRSRAHRACPSEERRRQQRRWAAWAPKIRSASLAAPLRLWVEQNGVRDQSRLELHLVHLELLRDRHGIRAVEARAAELLGRAAPDRPHQAGNRQVRQAVRTDVPPHLVDGAAGGDQFLGRADVDSHEAWKAHRRARDAHVDLARTCRSQPLDDLA